ncbi:MULTISPECIES: ABC transporter ATP-binding protein [Gordonibacter]|uniref:ABC transporter ATP-binding protein n=1 Tax=Gordonibacter faecis TaxID=3047475 RepID=A0ABT7DIP1_9ACTN|nr:MULTISPECIES: ABC transporter ATP-binding protein [unclassified Gordonibacter]MDJ1649392.1 ABC transporter ATP-binding protein [Gordonibacter sp. KGMB12511]HIW75141.1 ABC transporter ATP-binding protein [Candidatus Gordonibacter avicola]
MNAVSFNHVSFRYSDAEGALSEQVLDEVTLEVPAGQCLVLTGASGCGKTTVTRLVNGLIPHVYQGELAGEVRVFDRLTDELGMDDLSRRVGSVFQNPRSQFFNLDTTSEIAFGCENLGLPANEIRSRVHDAACDLGVEHLLDRDIRALSGGQRQMVALASVYALGPDILVLDEPTAALDVHAMRTLARTVARCKDLGKTVIVSEHRLWWLRDMADRIVHVEGGRIAHDWTAEEFDALSVDERHALGLRAWRLDELHAPIGPTSGTQRGANAPPAFAVEDLHVGYGRARDVLSGATAAWRAGSVTALVGSNGAGKSTLARCAAGLHRERAGSVALAGRSEPCRRRAGRVFLVMQEPGYQLLSDTVRGELEGAAVHVGRQTDVTCLPAAEALSRFGLENLASRHPLSLSGGERQRTAIAVGTLQGARVVVLDEPTSGLDYGNMERVARELRRLRDEGACVLVITHDYEFLCTACDSIVVLDGGVVTDHYRLDDNTLDKTRRTLGFAS